MTPRRILIGAAAAFTLGVGTAVAWGAVGASPQTGPTNPPYAASRNPVEHPDAMAAMHRGLDRTDLDAMVKACAKLMKNGGMMDADDMSGGGHGASGGTMHGSMATMMDR